MKKLAFLIILLLMSQVSKRTGQTTPRSGSLRLVCSVMAGADCSPGLSMDGSSSSKGILYIRLIAGGFVLSAKPRLNCCTTLTGLGRR